MAALHPTIALDTAADIPEIRRIGPADLSWALAEGWRDFREKRGDLLFIGLLYPAVCLIAVVFTFNDPLLPLFFPLVAGLSIAGPAVASGSTNWRGGARKDAIRAGGISSIRSTAAAASRSRR